MSILVQHTRPKDADFFVSGCSGVVRPLNIREFFSIQVVSIGLHFAVLPEHLRSGAVHLDPPFLHVDRPLADLLDQRGGVGNEKDRPPVVDESLDAVGAAVLERLVSNGKHLVEHEDLGLQKCRDREREPDVHPARIPLHRRVDELLQPGKRNDVVELACDLRPAHPEDRPVEIDVLAPAEFPMEPGPDLEQASHPSPDPDLSGRRGRNPGNKLQQSGLARPVRTDDPNRVPLRNLEGDIPERPEFFPLLLRIARNFFAAGERRQEFPCGMARIAQEHAAVDASQMVKLADVFGGYGEHGDKKSKLGMRNVECENRTLPGCQRFHCHEE